MRAEKDFDNIDLQKAIEMLREHRETHVDWRDWLRRHPAYPTEDLGDADFHADTVRRYDAILGVLEPLLASKEDR